MFSERYEVWGMTLHHKVLISDIQENAVVSSSRVRMSKKNILTFLVLLFTSYNITQTNRSYL